MAKNFYFGVNNVARKTKKAYIGIDGIARKIKKAYIGVDNKARLFYSSLPNITGIARSGLGATTVGNYALFAGGLISQNIMGSSISKEVMAIDTSFVQSYPEVLSTTRNYVSAVTLGNYALIASQSSTTLDVYDSSLTKVSISVENLSGATSSWYPTVTTVGNYALFVSGSYADAYDLSLTKTKPSALSKSRIAMGATTVGNYALFAGGYSGSNDSFANVDAYNDSLTKKTVSNGLTNARYLLGATTVGNYALFAGGWNYTNAGTVNYVESYNSSLAKRTVTELTGGSSLLTSVTINGNALFAGGRTAQIKIGSITTYNKTNRICRYDTSLTKKDDVYLSENKERLAGAVLGNYAIFLGGAIGTGLDSFSSKVDIFEF